MGRVWGEGSENTYCPEVDRSVHRVIEPWYCVRSVPPQQCPMAWLRPRGCRALGATLTLSTDCNYDHEPPQTSNVVRNARPDRNVCVRRTPFVTHLKRRAPHARRSSAPCTAQNGDDEGVFRERAMLTKRGASAERAMTDAERMRRYRRSRTAFSRRCPTRVACD
jgi:hypothetical protein